MGDEAEDPSVIFCKSICPSTANLYEADICEGLTHEHKTTQQLNQSHLINHMYVLPG